MSVYDGVENLSWQGGCCRQKVVLLVADLVSIDVIINIDDIVNYISDIGSLYAVKITGEASSKWNASRPKTRTWSRRTQVLHLLSSLHY